MPYLRPALIVAVILAEYLTVSFLFDAQTLFRATQLGRAFTFVGSLAPLLVVALTATLLLSGQEISRALRAVSPRPLRSLLPYLVVNVVAFGVFLGLTRALALVPARTGSLVWLLGWLAAAAVAFAAAALAAVPPGAIRALGTRATLVLGLATAVGGAAWAAGLGTSALWPPFARATLLAAQAVLSRFYADAFSDPATLVLGVGQFAVVVSAPCSGFEGIGLCVVLMTAYLWFFRARLRFPAALLLLPIAVVAAWVGNVARIAALVAVGVEHSADVALGAFHAKAGWLLFSALCLAVAAIGGRSRFFSRAPEQSSPEATRATAPETGENPTAAFVAPLVVFASAALVTSAFAAPFDHFYFLRVLAGGAVLFAYRRPLLALPRRPSWLGPAAGLVVFAFWLPLTASEGAPADRAAFAQDLGQLPWWDAALWLSVRVLGAVVVVPLVEELAFRGFLLRRLVSPDFENVDPRTVGPMPLLISSLLFGLVHGGWLAGTLAGLCYALVVRRTGRLVDAVVAHATTNLLLAIYVLVQRDWPRWF